MRKIKLKKKLKGETVQGTSVHTRGTSLPLNIYRLANYSITLVKEKIKRASSLLKIKITKKGF